MNRSLFITLAIVSLSMAAGCSSPQKDPIQNAISGDNGELVYLICETRTQEGETTPRRVCWEPSEGESATANREALVLYCEKQEGEAGQEPKRVCKEIEGVECEMSAQTGTHIAKLSCMRSEDKKMEELRDQYQLEKARIQSK